MKVLLPLIFFALFLPSTIFAAASLDRINKPLASFGTVLHRQNKPLTSLGTVLHMQNQKVCDRFQEDVNKMAAIMDELKDRKGITETRVAFGGSDTPIKQADYWVNFSAEAIAYQRIQQYSSKQNLRSNLEVLKGKILRAKNEVRKALDEQ